MPLTDFATSLAHRRQLGSGRRSHLRRSRRRPGADVPGPSSGSDPCRDEPGEQPPLLHLIHGGPHGAFTDGWQWRWHAQCFAARGYLVAMVNFHGSTSFGAVFTSSIQGAWGDKPYRDIEAATDLLVGRGLVDETRMAVAGGSYGGYLVAFITGQTDRYSCAVAHAAVTNLGGMYASDITAGRALAYGAEIFEDRARVERYSPSSHAAGYNTPTLVIHGERDYRVPLTQGLELYGVLKAKEVPARLVYYPSENHWILNPQPSLHWYRGSLRMARRLLEVETLPAFLWVSRFCHSDQTPDARRQTPARKQPEPAMGKAGDVAETVVVFAGGDPPPGFGAGRAPRRCLRDRGRFWVRPCPSAGRQGRPPRWRPRLDLPRRARGSPARSRSIPTDKDATDLAIALDAASRRDPTRR